jgi:hypothetical protein
MTIQRQMTRLICIDIRFNSCSKTLFISQPGNNTHMLDTLKKIMENKETLEEAAEKYATNHGMMAYVFPEKKESFIQGAKWQQERSYSEEDLNKHVVEFLEWREEYFEMYHGNKNHGLYYARNKYNSLYYNEDRHTVLTRKYYNLHELLELFNKFKKK